ncbi:DUF1801 domain-containing protein [Devosia sp. CAU 1758]
MSIPPGVEVDALLAPHSENIAALFRPLVDLLGTVPEMTGVARFGWRSVNFRHSRAGLICAAFPYADRVALYFENGRMLDDPEGLLEGDLKKGRFLRLYPGQPLPRDAILLLVAEAIALRS